MFFKKIFALLLLSCMFTGCQKYYVSARQVPVTEQYLASSHVGTPDPRSEHPPYGQELIIDWKIPAELLLQKPHVMLFLIYKNHTESTVSFPIEYKSGYVIYPIIDKKFDETKGALTYRAEIVTQDGKVFKEWTHQLWVKLINFDDNSSMDDSVSDQPKQASVIETPGRIDATSSDKN